MTYADELARLTASTDRDAWELLQDAFTALRSPDEATRQQGEAAFKLAVRRLRNSK